MAKALPGGKRPTKKRFKWRVPAVLKKARAKFPTTAALAAAMNYEQSYLGQALNGKVFAGPAMQKAARDVLSGKRETVPSRKHFLKMPRGTAAKVRGAIASSLLSALEQPQHAGSLVVQASSANFEALYDAGQAMGGSWPYKRKVGKDWFGVLRLPTEQAIGSFKALGASRAKEIVRI